MSLSNRISSFNRRRKWKLFNDLFSYDRRTLVLDVGYSDIEYTPTENYLEKNYPYLHQITALGIDEPNEFPHRYPMVNVVQYPGDVFPFEDKSFDICWSNAVLEHVGDEKDQILFVKEIARVSKKAFMTTPNRFFPVELHTKLLFVHFFPDFIFDAILVLLKKEWFIGDRLLSKRTLKQVLLKAGITDYKIYANRLFFFVLDYVVVFQ